MVKKLTSSGCPIPPLDRSNNRVLFAKPICNSYDQAITLLKSRNLGPGDIAVVRYYLNNTKSEWNDPAGLPIRMLLGVGGANAQADDDIYIFNDSRIEGGDYITADDVELMLVDFLSNYYTKSEIDNLLSGDEAWKTIVNNRLKDIDDDIDELRKQINNIDINVDLSNYYTKEEVNELFDSIEIPQIDLSEYYTKTEITEILETYVTDETLLNELDNKADVSDVEDVSNKLSTKADIETVNKILDELDNKVDASTLNSTVENLVNDALENSSNITNAVNSAIESADIPGQVALAVEGMDLVSNEKFDASLSEKANANEVYTKEEITEIINNIDIPEVDLSNYYTKSEVDELIPDVTNFVTNEQLTTEVQNQIESSEIIKELQTKVETLDHLDGEELDIWYLTFASSEDDINTAIINNENVELESDIALTSTLIFDENSDMAINIADSRLTKSGNGAVIRVNGGKLIIDGNNGNVDGNNNGIESGDNNAVRCSENGHIIINGGHFTVGDDGKNTGNALIYCTEGIIEIYGGTFEYTNSNNGKIYTLNCQDANYKVGKAKIIVYGGTFLNGYDPADSKSENPAGNFVANGYKSVYNENNNSYTVIPE